MKPNSPLSFEVVESRGGVLSGFSAIIDAPRTGLSGVVLDVAGDADYLCLGVRDAPETKEDDNQETAHSVPALSLSKGLP